MIRFIDCFVAVWVSIGERGGGRINDDFQSASGDFSTRHFQLCHRQRFDIHYFCWRLTERFDPQVHLFVNEYIQRSLLFREQVRRGIAPLGSLADDAKSLVTELVLIFAERAKRDVEDIGMQDRILTSIYIVLELRYVKLTR